MHYQQTIRIEPKRATYIKQLLHMTGKEIYDRYGLKRDETITETVSFPDTPYEMDIKLVIPLEETDTPWTEAVLFYHGSEIACSDVNDEFFGPWEFEDDNNTFTVILTEVTQ